MGVRSDGTKKYYFSQKTYDVHVLECHSQITQ
jgi:hypothetical protein